MKKVLILDRARTQASLNVTFDPIAMVVENPSGSPIYVREGSPEIPTAKNYDHIIAAATQMVIPVVAQDFGVSLASAALLASSGASISGLSDRVIITILGIGETIPTFGSASFLSLSLSDLSGGLTAYSVANPGTLTLTPSGGYDLGPWGGLVVEILPSTTAAQGRLVWYASNDALSWNKIGVWPIWADSPFTLNLPRVARYARLDVEGAALGGTPVNGTFSARGSLAEILNAEFTSTGGEATIPFTITPGGANNYFYIFTQGLEFMTVSLEFNTYGALDDFTYTFDIALVSTGPWRRLISDHAQLDSNTDALTRGFSTLSGYMRVNLKNNGAANMVGNIRFRANSTDPSSSTLATMAAGIGGLFWENESIFNYMARMAFNNDSQSLEVSAAQLTPAAGVVSLTAGLIPQPGITNVSHWRKIAGYVIHSTGAGLHAIYLGTGAVAQEQLWQGYISANVPLVLNLPGYRVTTATGRNIWVYSAGGFAMTVYIYTIELYIGF